MTKRIVYTNTDGGISVVIPAPGVSIEDCVKSVPAGVSYEIVDVEAIPTDREFRAAWKQNGKLVGIDIEKAKEVKKAQLRAERAPLLADLDVAYIRALEAGDTTEVAAITARKQELRDITVAPELLAADSVEKLKKVKLPKE